MPQCTAKNNTGKRCLNSAKHGDYCSKHKSHGDGADLLALGVGAVVGAMAAPGLVPVILGAAAGKALKKAIFTGGPARKKRVFVSFDFDNDQGIKHLIIGQTKNPDLAFDVADYSLKEAAPEKHWVDKAKRAIASSDLVLVVVGKETYRAPGVRKEVQIARELGIKVAQVKGYATGRLPPVQGAGRLYSWSHANLKTLLA